MSCTERSQAETLAQLTPALIEQARKLGARWIGLSNNFAGAMWRENEDGNVGSMICISRESREDEWELLTPYWCIAMLRRDRTQPPRDFVDLQSLNGGEP